MAKQLVKYFGLILMVFLGFGCASKNCRIIEIENKKALSQDLKVETIKVFKYDGSLQCGMGKGTPLEEMQKELVGIAVQSAENRNDGLMRIQLCGAPTGQANVYEIPKADLEKAQALGFKAWSFGD